MTRDKFIEQYERITERAMYLSNKTRKEGLLVLEGEIDWGKRNERDIFEYGLGFVLDGTDPSYFDKLLSNIVNQEKDEQIRTLKTIQKEAALMIQDGSNYRIVYLMLNSYTDIPLNEDKLKQVYERYRDEWEKYYKEREKEWKRKRDETEKPNAEGASL